MAVNNLYHSTPNKTKLLKHIYPSSIEFDLCPRCGNTLVSYAHFLNPSPSDGQRILGKACLHCDAFFATITKTLFRKTIRQLNPDYIIHDDYGKTYDRSYHHKLFGALKSLYCQIVLYSGKEYFTYYIVIDPQEANLEKHIYRYSFLTARVILSSIQLGKRTVQISGCTYTIVKVKYAKQLTRSDKAITAFAQLHEQPVIILKKAIEILEETSDLEFIDALVFGAKDEILKCLRVAADKNFDLYYVDPAIYRNFTRQYGVALLYHIYPDDGHSRYTALKSESILHIHGYTVNAKDNLSAHERQELLATLVDLGIISIEKIVFHLNFCIESNTKRNPMACEKWEEDLAFILNYRHNPSRFIFGKVRSMLK